MSLRRRELLSAAVGFLVAAGSLAVGAYFWGNGVEDRIADRIQRIGVHPQRVVAGQGGPAEGAGAGSAVQASPYLGDVVPPSSGGGSDGDQAPVSPGGDQGQVPGKGGSGGPEGPQSGGGGSAPQPDPPPAAQPVVESPPAEFEPDSQPPRSALSPTLEGVQKGVGEVVGGVGGTVEGVGCKLKGTC